MKKTFVALFAALIALTFICPALSADNPVDKSKQAPAKIDKPKTDVNKEKAQSKEVKATTGNPASKKTDKALGSGGGIVPPGPIPPGPVGKSTNSGK